MLASDLIKYFIRISTVDFIKFERDCIVRNHIVWTFNLRCQKCVYLKHFFIWCCFLSAECIVNTMVCKHSKGFSVGLLGWKSPSESEAINLKTISPIMLKFCRVVHIGDPYIVIIYLTIFIGVPDEGDKLFFCLAPYYRSVRR